MFPLDKGFFIVVVKRKSAGAAVRDARQWQADLIDPVHGWGRTGGENIEAAVASQKEQYNSRIAANQAVPALVGIKGGPMASGQTVRFVAVK